MDDARRPHLGLLIVLLFGLFTLAGCAKVTSGTSNNPTSSVATNGTAKILTKADQQISHRQINAAIKTLKTADTSNSTVKNLLTGLQHYQKAATALNKNQLSVAKTYFSTLSNYQASTDATFNTAKTALLKEYRQVKLANGYYNTARDELSVHDLTAAKTNIDKLDKIPASHPVIKQLQKKTLAMKQAIMNYEASQSTSSGSDSSTVVSSDSSSTSSTTSSTSVTSSDSSTESSSSSSADSSSTATSDATSSTSSTNELTTKQVLSNFRAAAGVSFAQDDQFNVSKQTDKYYQIEVLHDSEDDNVTNLTDIYRYYPTSGRVTKQNSSTGEFE